MWEEALCALQVCAGCCVFWVRGFLVVDFLWLRVFWGCYGGWLVLGVAFAEGEDDGRYEDRGCEDEPFGFWACCFGHETLLRLRCYELCLTIQNYEGGVQ